MKNTKSKSKFFYASMLITSWAITIMVCLTAFTSHKSKPLQKINPEVIKDRAEAKALYKAFQDKYKVDFGQLGGSLTKESLDALSVQVPKGSRLYYFFGRTPEGENCLMFFSNPANPGGTINYRSTRAYCPNDCGSPNIIEYLSGQ